MATEISTIEPLLPPSMDRPGAIPLWPVWLVSLLGACERTTDVTLEIPANRALTDQQRNLISSYVQNLEQLSRVTPENDKGADQRMLVALTQMLKVLAGSKSSASESELKAEAYTVAVEDLPIWAIEAAIRGWYRGAYGERNYAWPPAPAELREAADSEAKKLRGRAIDLRKLLHAQPIREYSLEHRAEMIQKIAAVVGACIKPLKLANEAEEQRHD
jgi:hypothetical protein